MGGIDCVDDRRRRLLEPCGRTETKPMAPVMSLLPSNTTSVATIQDRRSVQNGRDHFRLIGCDADQFDGLLQDRCDDDRDDEGQHPGG